MSTYTPTGFRRGRPRKGEIRPPTPGGVWQAEWRERQKAENPDYFVIQADYQRLWQLANPGKKAEVSKGYLQREAHWERARAQGGVSCKVKF